MLIALALFSASIFYVFFGDATHGVKRASLQVFIWLVIGAYFVRSWMVRGQTLAMRSWKLTLVGAQDANDAPRKISLSKAVLRYVLCSLNLAFLGLGFFYSFFDVERRFLYDKWLQLTIIDTSTREKNER